MIITLSFSSEEAELVRNYAQTKGITVPELIKKCVLERIEDECDLGALNVAIEKYREAPGTYTLDEVEKELGLA